MSGCNWLPPEVDAEELSGARVYDYLLGGTHNFAQDRETGEEILSALPRAREVARMHRAFLRRAVLFLTSRGVHQFLELGSGLPAEDHVHEVAGRAGTVATVVYVDWDPVVAAHSELLLAGVERTTMIQADLCSPQTVLTAPETRRLLDLTEPVGLMMVGVGHYISDDQHPARILAEYHDGLAAGSYLALSHLTADTRPDETAAGVELATRRFEGLYPRSRVQLAELLTGFDLVEPGLVTAPLWRPDAQAWLAPDADRAEVYACVGSRH
jgi:hypothetical protein